jgi:transposase
MTVGAPGAAAARCASGIVWILRTEAQWSDLPERYPPYHTCHRRFQPCVRDGTLECVLETLARDLKERGQLDLSDCFIDGTFIVAKKGSVCGNDQAGQKNEAHGNGRPRWSSSRRLCRHGCASRGHPRRHPRLRFLAELPAQLIGDRAYDADPLDEAFLELGIEMIAPHRRGRKRPKSVFCNVVSGHHSSCSCLSQAVFVNWSPLLLDKLLPLL